MNSSSWFQQQSAGVQTLLLVGLGLLIASPYWLMLIYRRREAAIKKRHEHMVQRGGVRAVVHQLPWYEHPWLKGLAWLTLLAMALRGFQATKDSGWFVVANIYYIAVTWFFARKAFSRAEFERAREVAPALDRKTWILRWAPFFVLLPSVGWLVNSLPIILGE